MAEEIKDFFSDPHFQTDLLRFLVHDREFLKSASHLLTEADFSSGGPISNKAGIERPIVARLALKFWRQYREPVGKMLKVELFEELRKYNWTPETPSAKRVLDYGESIVNGIKREHAEAMLERVMKYKLDHQIANAMVQMTEAVTRGTLTRDQFLELSRKAVENIGSGNDAVDIFSDKELEKRISRRLFQMRYQRFPVLLIDPVDRLVRIIARKHLGLIMAPYGRGKTLLFVHIALAYMMQGLNVLHFTLEDPGEDIEDRYDAAITALPIVELNNLSDIIRIRFKRYKRKLRSRLKVYDGTDGHMTINAIENIWEQERNRGFTADVILVDYDDEVKPSEKKTDRRMEFADIYRDYRAVLARHQLIGWIATQTTRQSNDLRIIGGKHVAEDISKIRKASFAISLGKSDWGPEAIFCWIAKHRYDQQDVGADIMMDKKRMLFYDRDATLKKEKEIAIAAATKSP